MTLEDPCDPPNQIIKPVYVNQVYTITDADATPYVIPEFSVDPIFCPIDYSYDISYLVDSNNADISAITQDTVNERKFSFFYDSDLVILDQSQKVTVTASSNSKYTATEALKKIVIASWDLTFLNPCIDTEFVTLTPTTQNNELSDTYTNQEVVFTY